MSDVVGNVAHYSIVNGASLFGVMDAPIHITCDGDGDESIIITITNAIDSGSTVRADVRSMAHEKVSDSS